eukprot:gnl/TRDRNA2_/TRDRNA2_174369_c2_seq6.p1 gnl/TRDRNA2_/TRDRNA2_174369_c2~~gnl/TRDRNA2_/TRDRNA2_174369_c2_seq6.p1  ORF type:complete len:470 (+),score=129.43 gnl/TRDRNA2_/TRDRNA2_174369_c2_seq6:70-1410(+)
MQAEVQQFASAPKAVGQRSKYRDENLDNTNLMHDRRVVRGSTYASLVMPQSDMAEVQKQREAQKRRLQRANKTTKMRPTTPEPVPGRKHMDIQTDSYLEELTERVVEFEAETQTDFLLDRPPSPLFMPAKIGVDADTQIEDGELFDFDSEVEPVLEVLVGKTLEQSMMEVLEEEELESMRRHQENFEKRRNAELSEVQRIEAAEKRRYDEMQRRMQQQSAQRQQDLSLMRKVVSRSIASAHLSSLRERALGHLGDAGVFTDTVHSAVESIFVPMLMQMVGQCVEQNRLVSGVLGDVTTSSVSDSIQSHASVLEKERQRLEALDEAERQERIRKENELLRKLKEKERIETERQRMVDWELIQPEPPETKELVVAEFDKDTSTVTFSDGTSVPVAEDQTAILEELLASKGDDQQLVAIYHEGADGMVIDSFECRSAEAEGQAQGEEQS